MASRRRMFSFTKGQRPFLVALSCGALALGLACNSKRNAANDGTAAASSASAASASASAASSAGAGASGTALAPPKPVVFNVPVGPVFAIEPGVGIGPIRFGATASTIERLMGLPCAEKSETLCRYPIHAVEFELENGALSRIHIHGHERPATQDRQHPFGIFNGKLLNGVQLGMYREYVESVMGPAPEARDAGPEPTERGFNLVHVAEYPGIRLEYDKLANGNVVLAGIVVTRADVGAAAAKPSASGKGASQPPAKGTAPSSTRPRPPVH